MAAPPKLSLDALVVLDAVARHASFARAAVELHKVPSALSYTIAQLESGLGLRLFDRSERKVRLTPDGADLLSDGRRLLRVAGDIERRLAQRAAGWEAELRVAVDTIFGLQALYPLLPAFDALQSGSRLSLLEEAVSGSWDALASDRADLIVAGLGAGGLPAGGGYQIHVLGRLSFDYAVAPTHPLAALAQRHGRPVTDEEVLPYRAVSVTDSSLTKPQRSAGLLAGQDTLKVATMRDKLAAQIAGLGVGFLPRFLAEPEFKKGSLLRLQVVQPRPDATFCLAHRQDRLGQAGRWWVAQLLAKAGCFSMLQAEPMLPAPALLSPPLKRTPRLTKPGAKPSA
jgi:DNA-binding transcriptional LysR family regulator